jgi:hypothetical protein
LQLACSNLNHKINEADSIGGQCSLVFLYVALYLGHIKPKPKEPKILRDHDQLAELHLIIKILIKLRKPKNF